MKTDTFTIKTLTQIGVSLCIEDENSIKTRLHDALRNEISADMIREVILTTYLFDGYPTALEGFRLLNEIIGSTERTIDEFIYSDVNIQKWRDRGVPLCRQIYGLQYEPLMKRVRNFAPELADAMIVEGYGKVLARDNLAAMVRELCVVAILTCKNKPRQLMSHSLGALRLGADRSHLDLVVESINEIVPPETMKISRIVIEQSIQKHYAR